MRSLLKILLLGIVAAEAGMLSAHAQELLLDPAQIDDIAAIASFFEACNGPKVRDEVLDYYRVTKKSQGTPTNAVDLQQIMIRSRIASATVDQTQCTDIERRRQANLLRQVLGTAPNP
jgi:hypothetical protein